MKIIFKYRVRPMPHIHMPQGAKLLSVQVQRGEPMLWALIDESEPIVNRKIRSYGTGHTTPDDPGQFVGTFQMDDGLVFHVFDEGE